MGQPGAGGAQTRVEAENEHVEKLKGNVRRGGRERKVRLRGPLTVCGAGGALRLQDASASRDQVAPR